MIYFAFIVALALVFFAALEYFYLIFLEARNRQSERRILQLERQNLQLREMLHSANQLLAERPENSSEIWSEMIDDER
jgi:uncharacterized membrane protein